MYRTSQKVHQLFKKKNHQFVLSDSLTLLLQILTWLCLLPTPFPGFRAGPLQRHEILSLFFASTSCFARRCPGVAGGWVGEISLLCLLHPWACPEGQEYQSGWVLKQQRPRTGQGGQRHWAGALEPDSADAESQSQLLVMPTVWSQASRFLL